MPDFSYINDNLIELIGQYEIIKGIFKENEIEILWKKYLYNLYQIRNIIELEKIRDKFIEVNELFYKNIIEGMNIEIIRKGKKMIEDKKLSNYEMFKFINKYSSVVDFYSDINLLSSIGKNINLKEFEKDEKVIKEYNQCKFLDKINKDKIEIYFFSILYQINDFGAFILFFKYIYQPKELNSNELIEEEKNILINTIIIKYFISLSNRNNFEITNGYKNTLRNALILSTENSIRFIEENEKKIKKNNLYLLIEANYISFKNEDFFALLIEVFINNSDIYKYITEERKNVASKIIIYYFYKNLTITEKKIDFLLLIKSKIIIEDILNTFLKLNLDFEIFLDEEKTETFINLSKFIKKNIFTNKMIIETTYYKELSNNCQKIEKILEEKGFTYKKLDIINELQKKNILSDRINCIYLGDIQKSKELEKKITDYNEKYRKYYQQLENLIEYYNYYFPKTKKNKIQEYKKIQSDFNNENIKISDIIIEDIDDEVKKFDIYDTFEFFKIFYKNIESTFKLGEIQINDEQNIEKEKFDRTVELFNNCEKIIKEEDINLSLFETALNHLDDKALLKEIIGLKNHFNYNNANENKILENLYFYKNKQKITISLKSLRNIFQIFSVRNSNEFISELNNILELIENAYNLNIINDIIQKLVNLDLQILDKNFCELLQYLYQKEELIYFLISQKESEARDLIDGLFDSDNEQEILVNLNDIEAFIKVVCFMAELKNNNSDVNLFLNNFHELLDIKNEIYKDIESNIEHINNKLFELKEFIKIQLGKNYSYTTNIEKFMLKGIIKFNKKEYERDNIFSFLLKEEERKKIKEYKYDVIIKIDNKEMNFKQFEEVINKIKAKNIYKYGKYKTYFLRTKKIYELISNILTELNFNRKFEFNKIYEVPKLDIEDKGRIKIKELEDDLSNLQKENYIMKNSIHRLFGNNPLFNIILNNFDTNIYNLDEENFKQKIENYFPNIRDVEEKEIREKGIHKNYICDGCGMNPLVGIRYHCKKCENFDFCENCMEKKKNIHVHEFEKFEKPVDYETPYILKFMYLFSEIKMELNYLKGIFFYKTTKDNYELDILKFCNTLFRKKTNQENSFFLPPWNCLLCYDNLKEDEIYSFCAKAISCNSNNLFMIIRPEELEIGNERYLIRIILEYLEKKLYIINSCIIVLYIDENSSIIKKLKNIKEKFEFLKEPKFFKTIEDSKVDNLYDLNVEIVTSDSPRVGKTTHILEQKGKDEQIFHIILGNIDQKYLIEKMEDLDFLNRIKLPILVHLELYENQDEKAKNLIRDFLFQFLILNTYKKFFNFGNNIKIFVEISSDYITFDSDFKILSLFKKYNINLESNPNFYKEHQINLYEKEICNFSKIIKYLNLLSEKELKYDSLIEKYFINKFPSKNKLLPNFGQIKMFVDLFGTLISNLNNCQKMDSKELQKYQENMPFLKTILKNIVLSYIEFINKNLSLNYENILEKQTIASRFQKDLEYNTYQEKKDKTKKLNEKYVISFSKIEPPLVLFNNIPEDDQEKKKCSILISNNEIDNNNKDKDFEYYENFNDKYMKCEHSLYYLDQKTFSESNIFLDLSSIFLTPNSIKYNVKENLSKDNYGFTIDNFIKMVFIYLRMRANIPIILLGETGCGKTSLIKAMSYFLKDRYELAIFNIHSGITYKDILDKLKEENIMLIQNKNKNDKEKNIILFFDEINTTNSLNILCDIFTKHSFLGFPLKNNIYVIAACNPYRLLVSEYEEIGYRNNKLHSIRNLAYSVNPLPLCLINYVLDFGNLSDENEKVYINKFVHSTLDNCFSKYNQYNYAYILELVVEAVQDCQSFIRNNSEISSVSLRELKRFTKFFDFFYNITKEKDDFKKGDFSFLKDESIFKKTQKKKEKIENIIILKTVNLCLFMCYYLRIIDPEKRNLLSERMTNKLKFDFLDYPLKLQNEIIENIFFDKEIKGIAKNKALKDNIFSLFVCLNNNVPVFICGKAGSSKTLSFSLLFESMKGKYSKNIFFQKYPSLYVTSYQGSLTSTSEEIKKIFKNARKINNQNRNQEYLSVVFIDELGLSEISPNNPLKVLHSEFDKEENKKVGFVGISNWTLDASKMNRGVHLSILEPNLEDLKLTANTISYDIYEEIKNNTTYQKLIGNLTESYYNYKLYLKKHQLSNYDFHGARDFYYLIKIASRLLKNNDKTKTIDNIAMESIERNFGGLESESKIFKQKYYEKINKNEDLFIDKCDIFSCIKNNLDEEDNRYLLLITERTKNDTLIEYILKNLNKTYRFIQGSKLKEDQNENYA